MVRRWRWTASRESSAGCADRGLTAELIREPACLIWVTVTGVPFPRDDLVAFLVAISFAAGLNVYATVAVLGLLARTGVLIVPAGLESIASEWVIGSCAVLFLVEFVADKIPLFDLIWNALHTFVRVPVAALIAYGATSHLGPGWQLAATMAGGTIALAAHGAKTAARVAVSPSPEPFSNFALSVAEDAFTIFITWFATEHPLAAAIIVAVLLVGIAVLLRWIARALRSLFAAAAARSNAASSEE
jgi:Domain of unknown function (DUF4126)